MAIKLGSSFARINAGSSSVKRMFRGASGIWNADAADWIKRVEANGGGVSTSTAGAVTAFCNAIDAAGIRDRFYRLNLFCGNSDGSLIAPRVPLYRGPIRTGTQYGNTLDTNVNFVQEDYAETGAGGGLNTQALTNKRLLTGFKLGELPDAITDNHIGAFVFAHTPNAANHWMLGSRESTSAIGYMRTSDTAAGQWTVNNGTVNSHVYGGEHPPALYLSSRRTATDHEIYEGNTSRGTSSATSSTAPYDGDNWIFSVNNEGTVPGSFPFRLGGYTFGLGLTSGQVSSFSSAWAAFNTALSRT